MPLPIDKREFDIFLSHAHKDRAFIDELDNWLSEIAGFEVWYDTRDFSAGSSLATHLQEAIERCKGALLVATDTSLKQGWVIDEYNAAMDERNNNKNFRVVALRINDADVSSLMKGISWIDVPDGKLTEEIVYSIVNAFYPDGKRPKARTARDVYISCSWKQSDSASANAVCKSLVDVGFRLVGDSKDQKGFGSGERVERVIASCGAFVTIIPYRGNHPVNADSGPYKYFIQELNFANKIGIPTIVIADPKLQQDDLAIGNWLRMDTDTQRCPSNITEELTELWDNWIEPPSKQYIFCAMDLDSSATKSTGPVRQLLERLTGMQTVVGSDIDEQPIHSAVMKAVCNAFIVIADITDDNINCCIEAGMAHAVETNVHLITQGKPRRPPFMLGTIQMPSYQNDVERIGLLHKIARQYRRRIINAEL